MPQVADDVGTLLEELLGRLSKLECRVSALETSRPVTSCATSAASTSGFELPEPASEGLLRIGSAAGMVPVLGKAVLAMAGAYLLRAIAESGTIARLPMVLAAIAYAGLWMAWAVRIHRRDHFASATYGTTATLILGPLLWEATVRFQLLSANSAAIVVVAFVVLVLVLAWHSNLQMLPWVATLASIATAWALILATHKLVALTSALLLIALATEITTCLGHRLSLWAMVAVAADAAVALFIYLMTGSDGVPSSYEPSSGIMISLLTLCLLGIYGGGIATRSLGLRKRITNFEIIQAILAFVLAYVSVERANSDSAVRLLGGFFLMLSLVCYWGTLLRFSDQDQLRNRRVSGMWAVVLMIAGTAIVFPASIGVLLLCVLGMAVLLLGKRRSDVSLAWHASFYLAAAAVLSPLPSYSTEALAGLVPGKPPWTLWVVVAFAVLSCLLAPQRPTEPWTRRLVWLTPAVLASFSIAALSVVGLHFFLATHFQFQSNAARLAGLRTVITCMLALGLGVLARRYKRPELRGLAYVMVGLGAIKLMLEDLRVGNASSLVISFVFYGLILILLPRCSRQEL